ncbi:MAG: T9SS type A sorting domain-containing protein [Chitinophagales bacterium]
MMYQFYSLFVWMLIPFHIFSQTTFSVTIDNNQNSEEAWSIIQLADGSFVIASLCLINPSWQDCMQLLKTDSLGNVIWNKQYDHRKPGYRGTLNPTQDGGFTLGTWWYADNGVPDVFLLKFDSEGDTLWTRQFGGEGRDIGWDTAELPDGSLVVVGSTESFGNGGEDIYVVKTDAQGNFQWQRTFGGPGRDVSANIRIEGSGQILISGLTSDTPTGHFATIFLKLDDMGNELLKKIILYSPNQDNCGAYIIPSIKKGYIINGCMDTIINEGNAEYPYYVGRLDEEANVEWMTYFNEDREKYVASIYELEDGHIMVQGINKNHPESEIYNTAWLAKVSPQGEILWERNYQGEEGDYSWRIQDMCLTLDGGFALAGAYRNIHNMENNPDVWILKVDNMGCLEPGCGSELIRVTPNYVYTDIEEVSLLPPQNRIIYPNPISADSKLYLGNHLADLLQIHDVTGRLLATYPIAANTKEVSLGGLDLKLKEGMYLATLSLKGRIILQNKLAVVR